MSTTTDDRLGALRQEVYASGMVAKVDGTMLEIVPHTPHPADGDALRDLVRAAAPLRTIEIGCATGLSTLAMFEGLARAGVSGDHVVVDPYFNGYWGGAAGVLMERAGIRGRVRVEERESVVALAAMLERGERFDFAFVDGCHWFECALVDVSLLCRLVVPGGVIAVDDTWMPAVRDAVAYCTSNLNCELVETIERNGKPRLSVLKVREVDRTRAWDRYVSVLDSEAH